MKNLILLFIITLFLSVSCTTENNKIANNNTPSKVCISGQIINPDSSNRQLKLSVKLPSLSNHDIYTQIDNAGKFSASFEIYTPTDVYIEYNTDFIILVHPGDSIYLSFRGDKDEPNIVFNSIKYSGSSAKINQDAIIFQSMYYELSKNDNYEEEVPFIKSMNAEDYIQHLISKRKKSRKILERFKSEYKPEKEAYTWALVYSESPFYYRLANYPGMHKYFNKINRDARIVSPTYFDSLLNILPITKEKLICGGSVSALVNTLHYNYVRYNIFQSVEYEDIIKEYQNKPDLQAIKDSLVLKGYLKFKPKSLAQQLVLAETIDQDFEMNNFEFYEMNMEIIKSTITEKFLIEPIINKYNILKARILNSEQYSDSVFNKLKNSTLSNLVDSILKINKNKVIYIKFWATWCGPCLNSFPSYNEMIKKMENKDVAFINICMDSEEVTWKYQLERLKVGGQNYFLNKTESADMHKIIDFTGFPYQLIIDSNGKIVEKGGHLEGTTARIKIEELLK